MQPQYFKAGMFAAFSALFTLFLPVSISNAATPLDQALQSYLDDVVKGFQNFVDSPTLKRSALKPTDRYFLTVLKSNQPYYSLLRVNSKGKVVNEALRSEGSRRDYRFVGDQPWFTNVAKTGETYHGFLKEKERYYLFWAKPVMLSGNRFGGAVLAKIDFWDILHDFSDQTLEPFEVKLGNLTVYSHKWDLAAGTPARDELNLPGLQDLTLVRQSAQPIAAAVEGVPAATDTDVAVQPAEFLQAPAVPAATETKGAFGPFAVGGGLAALILLVVFFLMRRNNTDDIL